MRTLAYDPNQVVHLSTGVGATLVIAFGPKETITAVAVTDSKDLKAMPKGNFLFLKSQEALPLQPVIVLTAAEGGEMRRYVFEITTVPAPSLAANAPGIYYSVQFTYPADDAARQRAQTEAQAAREQTETQARAAHLQLQAAHNRMEQQARDPFSGERNWHYVAQGNRSLLPLEVFDNGFSTVFRFPGNVRIPSVFVINPDGKEATPNYAVKGDFVQVEAVARGWRLRDGDTVPGDLKPGIRSRGPEPRDADDQSRRGTCRQGGTAMSGSTNRGAPGGVNESGSLVAGAPGRQLTAAQKIGVAGLVLVVFLSFIWIGHLNGPPETKSRNPTWRWGQAGQFHPAPLPSPPDFRAVPLPMPAPVPAASMFAPPRQHEMTAAESPIFAFSGGGAAVEAPAAAPPGPTALSTGGDPRLEVTPPSGLATMLKPTVLSGSRARLLPHPDMMVTMGTVIPCTLQTAINSQLAGYVKCVLPQDVRSTTGNVVLLDRGTTVVGEIGRGLAQGQDRIFVLWDRAETPDHAVIELSSPGTDELGRSGLPGGVNNHWWERFGSAILLSVIQGGLETGTALAATSGSHGGTFFNSFQANGTNISDTALQATINIPPTLEKNQGDNVAIFVARDLDFSDVYKLRLTGGAYGQ